MAYKWRPSASQRRAFAEKMQNDEDFKSSYLQRKAEKREQFYNSLEKKNTKCFYYVTKEQYNFAMYEASPENEEQKQACDMVVSSFAINEKCDHFFIHIVNEMRRNQTKI